MLLMFERGTRGGIIQAVNQYTQAINKYMGDQFDPTKENHYLQYLDANNYNLYGWAMSQPLPNGQFKWVESPDKLKGQIANLVKNHNKGYLLDNIQSRQPA